MNEYIESTYRYHLVFNTFFALLTQEEQVRCFRNVAAHLAEDGTFVIDAFVPDMKRFTGGQEVRAHAVTTEHVSITGGTAGLVGTSTLPARSISQYMNGGDSR